MSSFKKITKHPMTGDWENADWLDNYFGSRGYGVRFPDGKVFNPEKINLEVKQSAWKERHIYYFHCKTCPNGPRRQSFKRAVARRELCRKCRSSKGKVSKNQLVLFSSFEQEHNNLCNTYKHRSL